MVRTIEITGSGADVGDWVVADPSWIRGRIVDEQGDPVGGAKVRLHEPWGSTLARADGKFTLPFPDGDAGHLTIEKADRVAVPVDTAKLKRGEPIKIVVYRGVEVRLRAGWAWHTHVAVMGGNVSWEPPERGEFNTSVLFPLPPLRLRLTLTDKQGRSVTRELDLSGRNNLDLGVIAPPN